LYYWRWEDSAKALQRAADVGNGGEEFTAAMSLSLMRPTGGSMTPLLRLNAGESATLCPSTHRSPSELPTAAGAARSCARRIAPRARHEPGQQSGAFPARGDVRRDRPAGRRHPRTRNRRATSAGHNSRIEAYLGYAYAAAGRTLDARAVLKELDAHRRDQYVSAFGIALIHDALGRKVSLRSRPCERACGRPCRRIRHVGQYPAFKTIASEPRFLAVMRQVGLPR
jgi:hypothetical protein